MRLQLQGAKTAHIASQQQLGQAEQTISCGVRAGDTRHRKFPDYMYDDSLAALHAAIAGIMPAEPSTKM